MEWMSEIDFGLRIGARKMQEGNSFVCNSSYTLIKHDALKEISKFPSRKMRDKISKSSHSHLEIVKMTISSLKTHHSSTYCISFCVIHYL